jgi:F-type H+-transporting ATPase subunit alpha
LKSSHPEALELILKNDIDAAGKILERAAKDLSTKFAKL